MAILCKTNPRLLLPYTAPSSPTTFPVCSGQWLKPKSHASLGVHRCNKATRPDVVVKPIVCFFYFVVRHTWTNISVSKLGQESDYSDTFSIILWVPPGEHRQATIATHSQISHFVSSDTAVRFLTGTGIFIYVIVSRSFLPPTQFLPLALSPR